MKENYSKNINRRMLYNKSDKLEAINNDKSKHKAVEYFEVDRKIKK